MFQSKSGSKKTLLPSSPKYKTLKKKHEFNYMNSVFKQLKPHIIKKLYSQICEEENKYEKIKISFFIFRND